MADKPPEKVRRQDVTHFYPRHAVQVRYLPSSCVRPSVLSVRSRCTTKLKTSKPRITQTTPYDSPSTQGLLLSKISTKFQRDHPQEVPQIEVGYVKLKLCEFRPLSRCISETVQDRDIL